MRQLYEGELPSGQAAGALAELEEACAELRRFPPSEVVWDVENRSAKPPWGSNISPDVTDLSGYFMTSEGRDLFEVLFEVLKETEDSGQTLRIE